MKKKVVWVVLCLLSIAYLLLVSGKYWVVTIPTLAMIGIHELGHLYAAKRFGLKTDGFYFIPGLGGAALLREFHKERWKDFWVFYAGPLAGLAQVLALLVINLWFNLPLLYALAGIWALINLLNLLPTLPLDGGKIFWATFTGKKSFLQNPAYYVLALFSLVIILNLTGLLFSGIVFLFGVIEKIILTHYDNNMAVDKIAMSKKQVLAALVLYLILSFAFVVIIIYELQYMVLT